SCVSSWSALSPEMSQASKKPLLEPRSSTVSWATTPRPTRSFALRREGCGRSFWSMKLDTVAPRIFPSFFQRAGTSPSFIFPNFMSAKPYLSPCLLLFRRPPRLRLRYLLRPLRLNRIGSADLSSPQLGPWRDRRLSSFGARDYAPHGH